MLPPRGVSDFKRRILAYSSQTKISPDHIQKLIAVAEVMKLLPEGTVVQGGNSLSIRYPIVATRASTDLDLVVEGAENRRKPS